MVAIRRLNGWGEAHPVGSQAVGPVVFVVMYVCIMLALGDGIPWFGLAVFACVWVVIAACVAIGRRRGSR